MPPSALILQVSLRGFGRSWYTPTARDLGGRDERHDGLVVFRAVVERDDPVDSFGQGRLALRLFSSAKIDFAASGNTSVLPGE
jgi:hypothetical protein